MVGVQGGTPGQVRTVIGRSQFCAQERVGEAWSSFGLGDLDAVVRVQTQ